MAWHDQPKFRDHPDVDAYIADQPEAQQGILMRVRDIVKEDLDVVEGIAWGVPCYFRHGPLCYTSAAKTHVTVGLFRGIEIDDPTGALTGTGKSPVAKAVVKPQAGLDEAAFRQWLAQAIQLDDAGD